MPEEHNVLVMYFPGGSGAFEALSLFKAQPGVIGAAVAKLEATLYSGR